MKKDPRRRRWLWLLLPILLIVALTAGSPHDDFAEYARRGNPFDPNAIPDLLQDPPRVQSYGFEYWPRARKRAWTLPDDPKAVIQRLRDRGFVSAGGGSGSASSNGKVEFEMAYHRFAANEIDTHVTVVESTKLPKQSRCVVLVQEPTGLSAAWRRFLARLHGFPKP